MNSRQLWFTGFLALSLLPGGSILQANPLQSPKRSLNGRTVDLNPLFRWWTRHDGPRPLAAWEHITGPIVATNAMGWVVEVQVAGRSSEKNQPGASGGFAGRIVLKNPPYRDLAEFEKLDQQYKALTAQKAAASAQASQLKHNADELQRERKASGRAGRGAGRAARVVRKQEASVNAAAKTLDQELEEVRKKLEKWPNAERYSVDCLAMDARQVYQGMRLFDHGVPLN